MSELVIRLARPDEYDRVGELTVTAYRALPNDHLVEDYDRQIVDVASRAAIDDVLVAVDADGTVLGACTFVHDPASPWMEWSHPGEVQLRLLAVDPHAQGRGVGEALVRDVIARARALGRPMILHTTQDMTVAQRLYERLGFRRVAERDENEVLEGFEFRAYRYDV